MLFRRWLGGFRRTFVAHVGGEWRAVWGLGEEVAV